MITKEELIQSTRTYLENNTFAPLCIGFFGPHGKISGLTGMRRAKRFIHLLEHASEEGVHFLICVMRDDIESASTLKEYLKLPNALELPNKEWYSQHMLIARRLFQRFLNVIHCPAVDFGSALNDIIKNFNYASATNHSCELHQKIESITHNVEAAHNASCLTSHYTRM